MSAPPSNFANAAEELLTQSARAARGAKIAFADQSGTYSFDAVREMVNRAANVLREMGLNPRDRVVLCLTDSIDFVASFLGAIQAGIVPIPLNTLWSANDYAFVLSDSRAKAAVVSEVCRKAFLEALEIGAWNGQLIASCATDSWQFPALQSLLEKANSHFEPHTAPEDAECFWLYSSGSTGRPKAAVHLERSLATTARLYAQGILGMDERDIVYSAAKLSFAYGLGNSLSFPLYVCAKAVLSCQKPTPEVVSRILREQRPTIFFGVPTLFAALLQSKELPGRGEHNLRFCVSAGEALPAELGRAWKERTGVDILDGIGSTEMLHIFISNVPGVVAYGTSGRPTPGYKVKLLDESGNAAVAGEIGDLWVSGPTCCAGYWNQPWKWHRAFVDGWMHTGDKYRETPEGNYEHCGRSDDMLKVGGFWVSPVEVESALMCHAAVLEAAVVGYEDEQGLVKPKAFVVLKPGQEGSGSLEEELKAFVKTQLAPYKYPRWIKFVPELPRTATGKLQRFRLRPVGP